MNDLPDLDRELRSTLTDAAEALDLELTPSDELARRGARRRRNKRVLAGCTVGATVVAVATIGVVSTRGDDGTVETADAAAEPTTPEFRATDDATTDDPATDDAPAGTASADDGSAKLPASAGGTTSAVSSTLVAGQLGADSTIAPWGDGFIRLTRTYPAQPLPESLPEELAALFPPEVLAVFPDGLPATVSEATLMLSEAGLLDVVTDLIEQHPELGEALLSSEPSAPLLEIDITGPTGDWEPVDLGPLDLLEAPFSDYRLSDGRLIVWAIDPTLASQDATVAMTADLTTWTTTSFALEQETDPTGTIQHSTWLQQIVPLGDGWIALVSHDSWVDWEALLPDDVLAATRAADGWGLSTENDGIEVTYGDERRTFTWDDLGLTGNPELEGGPDLGFLVADASGNVTSHPATDNGWGELISWNGQAVLLADGVRITADGATWRDLAELPPGTFANGGAPVGDQLLLTGNDMTGATAGWLIDVDGSVAPVELPDLPHEYGLWGARGSAAWIVELYDMAFEPVPVEPSIVTFEFDGSVIELVEAGGGGSIVVTDAATGELIIERTYTFDDPATADLYQFDEATGEAWLVVTDDETGDELLRVPGDVLDDAYQSAHDNEPAAEEPAEEWNPDFWVVATVDGVNWYTADIADPEPGGPWIGQAAAINGTTLMYQSAEGWHRVELGG